MRQNHQNLGKFWQRALRLTALLLSLAGPVNAHAGNAALPEADLKALFLFNFAKYVEWPDTAYADANAPIRIGVIGDKKVTASLKAVIYGEMIGTRPLEILEVDSEQDIGMFHILFVAGSENRSHNILDSVKTKTVLTVGESEQFAESGGVIIFTKKENKIHFQVNLSAARQAKLQISSKLLSLADSVHGKN